MKAKITSRQQDVLNVILNHMRDNGRPPTVLEICSMFGWRSPNAAQQHLAALQRKGWIRLARGPKGKRISRNIQIA